MITRKMEFYSNCYRLAAALYLPDDYEEGQKLPCIIPNSGYMGLNEIYPALFARALTKRGFACFGFDYRGFLDNGGPAGVCKLDEQVEDIRNAVTFAGTLAEVDTDRIGLLCKNRHPSPICTRFEHHLAGGLAPLSRTEAPRPYNWFSTAKL